MSILFMGSDLWPESVKVAGGINNKIFWGINFTKMIYKHTDKILVQYLNL